VPFHIILDVILAFLLVLTIGYSWRLSKKINVLHAGRRDLEEFLQDFDTAINKAQKHIESLKDLGDDTNKHLKHHIEKARFLTNDLSFLMSKGANVADTLEKQIHTTRNLDKPKPSPKVNSALAAMAAARSANNVKKNPTASENRASEPKAPSQNNNERKPAVAKSQMPTSKKRALDDVLAQIASRKEKTATAPTQQTTAQPKSPVSAKEVAKNLPKPQRTPEIAKTFNDRRLEDATINTTNIES